MTQPQGALLTPPVGWEHRVRGASGAEITPAQIGDCPYTVRSHAAKVNEQLASGPSGTPTYFINGVRQDFETLPAAMGRAER